MPIFNYVNIFNWVLLLSLRRIDINFLLLRDFDFDRFTYNRMNWTMPYYVIILSFISIFFNFQISERFFVYIMLGSMYLSHPNFYSMRIFLFNNDNDVLVPKWSMDGKNNADKIVNWQICHKKYGFYPWRKNALVDCKFISWFAIVVFTSLPNWKLITIFFLSVIY